MKKIVLSACALMAMTAMQADDKVTQEVLVDGQPVAKNVKTITFNGDKATLVFTDNTDLTADMESVVIHFSHDLSGVNAPSRVVANKQQVFNLKGQRVKNGLHGLSKGIYVIDGRKVVVGSASMKNNRQGEK